MTNNPIALPQGTLDLLILKSVALEPRHGWEISQRIEQMSGERLQVQQGSLYPALHRLERRGWVSGEWEVTGNNRRAKYYRITAAGRRQLESETRNWRMLVTAVEGVLETG